MKIANNIPWIYIDFKRLRKVMGFFSRPYLLDYFPISYFSDVETNQRAEIAKYLRRE
jgi:hypothetical protein